jgi:nitric oxide reductase subunit B
MKCWGHGSYLAPDWSADWLHREATALLASYAVLLKHHRDHGTDAGEAVEHEAGQNGRGFTVAG